MVFPLSNSSDVLMRSKCYVAMQLYMNSSSQIKDTD